MSVWEKRDARVTIADGEDKINLFANDSLLQMFRLLLFRLSWSPWLSLNHQQTHTCHHKLEITSQAETTVPQQLPRDSHREAMVLQLRTETHLHRHQEAVTDLPLNNSQAQTMVSLNKLLQAQATEFHQLKISTTLTANVPTAINKHHQALMVSQLPKPHRSALQDILQVQAVPADTQMEDMRNQPNTNSNMMFKTSLPDSISVTRNNVKAVLLPAVTTSCFPMDVNR
jgi:hypothetical protein